jgi:hypothetical protein
MKFRNVINLLMAVCVAAVLLVSGGCQKKAEETTPAAAAGTTGAAAMPEKEGAGKADSATMTPGPGVSGAENVAGSKTGK